MQRGERHRELALRSVGAAGPDRRPSREPFAGLLAVVEKRYAAAMAEPAPPTSTEAARLQVLAVHAFERIDTRALAKRTDAWLASNPFTVRLVDDSVAVCLRYGAIVFFDSTQVAQTDFLAFLEGQGNVLRPTPHETERLAVLVDPTRNDASEPDQLVLSDRSFARLQLVAEVLGRSVAMASYEHSLREAADRVEPLASELARSGTSRQSSKQLLKTLGSALHIRQLLVGRAEVNEKPDLLWDQPALERLYAALMEDFEIPERNALLDAKLTLVNDTAQTALSLVQHAKSLRVEWYIVGLIVFEIVLTLFDWAR